MGCLIAIVLIALIVLGIYDPVFFAIFGVILICLVVLFFTVGGGQKQKEKKQVTAADIFGMEPTNEPPTEATNASANPNPIVVRLSLQQFNSIKDSISKAIAFCKKLSLNEDIRKEFYSQAVNSNTYQDYKEDDFFTTLKFFLANDLFYSFEHLGHKLSNFSHVTEPVSIDYHKVDGQALYATVANLSGSDISFDQFRNEVLSMNQDSTDPYDGKIRSSVEQMLPAYLNSGAKIKAKGIDDFNFVLLLRSLGHDEMIPEIRQILFEFAKAIATSDNELSPEEKEWLDSIHPKKAVSQPSKEPDTKDDNSPSTMEQLQSLIGLHQVKEELQQLSQFIAINQMRKDAGMRVVSISYHYVFEGNPGTGKTTVARILAGIYKQLGILEKGQLVETDRSGLVAEYVGQTAVKTNKIIDKAIGGVLFIDEAYTLAQGGDNDYGREAIATLLKRMEDDRDRLVVILAGYTNEIEQFINSNPGLRSRFNRYIHFQDYTEDELFQIFLLQAKKYDYRLSDDAKEKLHSILKQKIDTKQKDFGNARFVRNLFEKVIENQAVRLAKSKDISNDSLAVITKDDFK